MDNEFKEKIYVDLCFQRDSVHCGGEGVVEIHNGINMLQRLCTWLPRKQQTLPVSEARNHLKGSPLALCIYVTVGPLVGLLTV